MKSNSLELWVLCLPGVMAWCFLCAEVGENPRAQLLDALPMLGLLIAALLAVNVLWIKAKTSLLLRWLFALFLIYSAAQSVARLWQTYVFFYPQSAAPWAVLLCTLAPVWYLRTSYALKKTALLVACCGGISLAVGILSLTGKLHSANLVQEMPMQAVATAMKSWLLFPPDLLVPCLLAQEGQRKKACYATVGLALVMGGILAGVSLLLRLYYGDAQQLLTVPQHTVFFGGELSVFTRLDWLQLLWWSLAAPVRTALLFYVATHLLQPMQNITAGGDNETPCPKTMALSMRRFAAMAAMCGLLVIFLQRQGTQDAAAIQATNGRVIVFQWGWMLWAIIKGATSRPEQRTNTDGAAKPPA